MSQCPVCDGVGRVVRPSFVDPKMGIEQSCSACKGKGTVGDDERDLTLIRAGLEAEKLEWCKAIIATQDGSSGRMVCDVETLLVCHNAKPLSPQSILEEMKGGWK